MRRKRLIGETLALLFLGYLAYEDAAQKRVTAWITVAMFIAGLVYRLLEGSLSFEGYLLAVTPGLLMLLAAGVTRGRIGLGDGMTLLGFGLLAGYGLCLQSIFWGALFSAAGAVTILIRTKNRNATIPFLPYLLAGYVASIGMDYL